MENRFAQYVVNNYTEPLKDKLMIPDYVLEAAKKKWPEINDKVKILITVSDKVIIPKMKLQMDDMNTALEKAAIRVNLTLHPEEYTLEEKLELSKYANDQFEMMELNLTDLIEDWQADYKEGFLAVRNTEPLKGE